MIAPNTGRREPKYAGISPKPRLVAGLLGMDGIVGLAIGIVALVLVVLKPFVQTLKIFAASEKDGKNLPVKNWT